MVGRDGFEPPKAKPADLQSAPVDRFGTDPDLNFQFLIDWMVVPAVTLVKAGAVAQT